MSDNAITLDGLSRDERSLLLYFESVCVDHAGLVDTRRMNADDIKIATKWDEIGFVLYGRVALTCLPVDCATSTH